MEMLLLDVRNNEIKVVEANGLEDYYKYIGCEVIDIVCRKIGGLTVEIVCDDEALFDEHPKTSAVDINGYPCLYGNLLVAGGTVIDGELTPLTASEIEHIKRYTAEISTLYHQTPYTVFREVDFAYRGARHGR
jgi:hypothetical protein